MLYIFTFLDFFFTNDLVFSGKYGEYICDQTENDVCSIECKKKDIEKMRNTKNTIPNSSPNNNQSLKNISDTTSEFNKGLGKEKNVSLKNAIQTHFQICPDVFHAQLTAYVPYPEINNLSETQVQNLLTKSRIIVHGKNIPRTITSFENCQLPPKVFDNLKNAGYVEPTSIQMQVIPAALVGRDILANAQTGSGKTVAFLIPTIIHTWTLSQFDGKGGPYAIIIAPTRELCIQIEDQTKKLVKGLTNMKTALLVGGFPTPNQVYRLKQGVQIAIATPGRFIEIINQYPKLNLQNIHMVIIDEVDMMLKVGFMNQVREILEKTAISLTSGYRQQILMFSATIPEGVEKLANSMLKDYIRISIGDQINNINNSNLTDENNNNSLPNIPIKQTILWVENKSKKKQLFSLLNDSKYYSPPIIVFVESKMGADLLAKAIEKKCNTMTLSLHGDKPQEERNQILQSFINGEYEILVATGILSRGLNLPDVNMIINFDMASSVIEYVHQVGRANHRGWAITFINEV